MMACLAENGMNRCSWLGRSSSRAMLAARRNVMTRATGTAYFQAGIRVPPVGCSSSSEGSSSSSEGSSSSIEWSSSSIECSSSSSEGSSSSSEGSSSRSEESSSSSSTITHTHTHTHTHASVSLTNLLAPLRALLVR
jgi:hypothetical protein